MNIPQDYTLRLEYLWSNAKLLNITSCTVTGRTLFQTLLKENSGRIPPDADAHIGARNKRSS